MNLRALLTTTALLASLAAFAGEKDPQKDTTEPDLIISVRAGKQTTVLVEGAKAVRTSEKGIAEVGLGEPNQLVIDGVRPGEVSAQVVRKQGKNFKLVVRVTQ